MVVATTLLLVGAGGARKQGPKLSLQHSFLFLVGKTCTGIPTVLLVPQVFLTVLPLLFRTLLLLSPTWIYRIVMLTPPPRQREEEAAEMSAAKLRSKINWSLNENQTPSRGHEIILVSLLGGLMREEDLIPDGTFLDAGAAWWTRCPLCSGRPRSPSSMLGPFTCQRWGNEKGYGELYNLRIEQGGLSKEVSDMKPRDGSFQMDLNEEFQLFTLDSLFYDKGEKLGFAHFTLGCGRAWAWCSQGWREDSPCLQTNPHDWDSCTRSNYTTELLKFLDKESYDTYIIDEVCGFPHQDYRNLLNIPRGLSRRMAHSDTFNLLHATERIFRVDADAIFEMVLPCCALGGECCPGGDLKESTCCDEKTVTNWYKKNNIKMSPKSMYGWKNSKKA